MGLNDTAGFIHRAGRGAFQRLILSQRLRASRDENRGTSANAGGCIETALIHRARRGGEEVVVETWKISDSYLVVSGGLPDGMIAGGKSISFGTSRCSGGGSSFGISGVGFG